MVHYELLKKWKNQNRLLKEKKMSEQKILDSWKRETSVSNNINRGYEQQLELQLNKTRDATPEEVREWQNGGDFFMTGNFDVMKLFVAVPTIVQLVMIGLMFSVFLLNDTLFK